MNEINSKLNTLLKNRIEQSHYRFPIQLTTTEVAELLSREGVAPELATGYISAFFDMLRVLGISSYDLPGHLVLRDEIQAATVRALCLAMQEDGPGIFDFEDSEDVGNSYFGSWFLYQLEERRRSQRPNREPSRMCETVVVLVKAKLGDQEAILFQHDGARAWGKYKFIGGRVRAMDNANLLLAAQREVKQEVRTSRQSAADIRVWQLSRDALEYARLSKRLGAYTLYRTHVFECILTLPNECLKESFLGEKGRETRWIPLDEVTTDNEALAQHEILKWIQDNRWFQMARLSTNEPIRGEPADTHKLMARSFNGDELIQLCADLDVPYEDLGGDTHARRNLELVKYMKRHGRFDELIAACETARPAVAWR